MSDAKIAVVGLAFKNAVDLLERTGARRLDDFEVMRLQRGDEFALVTHDSRDGSVGCIAHRTPDQNVASPVARFLENADRGILAAG